MNTTIQVRLQNLFRFFQDKGFTPLFPHFTKGLRFICKISREFQGCWEMHRAQFIEKKWSWFISVTALKLCSARQQRWFQNFQNTILFRTLLITFNTISQLNLMRLGICKPWNSRGTDFNIEKAMFFCKSLYEHISFLFRQPDSYLFVQ